MTDVQQPDEGIPTVDGDSRIEDEYQQTGEPEQTDNRPRDEDGEQDITQDPEPCPGSV